MWLIDFKKLFPSDFFLARATNQFPKIKIGWGVLWVVKIFHKCTAAYFLFNFGGSGLYFFHKYILHWSSVEVEFKLHDFKSRRKERKWNFFFSKMMIIEKVQSSMWYSTMAAKTCRNTLAYVYVRHRFGKLLFFFLILNNMQIKTWQHVYRHKKVLPVNLKTKI